jgi:hypothetical protein
VTIENGNNPAVIQVGATYPDLGATITGPQAELNLGITTYVNGALNRLKICGAPPLLIAARTSLS